MLFEKPCYFALFLVALFVASALTESNSSPEASNHESGGRLLVFCNQTLQGPKSCASCKNALLCSNLNVGVLVRCSGARKHCNDGRCSETPSANCNSTSDATGRVTVGGYISWGKGKGK